MDLSFRRQIFGTVEDIKKKLKLNPKRCGAFVGLISKCKYVKVLAKESNEIKITATLKNRKGETLETKNIDADEVENYGSILNLLALKFKIKKNDANLKFKKILDLLTNDNEIKIIGVVDD